MKKNFSFLAEIQIANVIEIHNFVINAMHLTKIISVRFEKTLTVDFVSALKLISITTVIKITNILSTNYNLNSNIEVLNTFLNSKNLILNLHFDLTFILSTNYKLNLDFIGVSNTFLNSKNFTLNLHFNSTLSPQFRTFTEENQHRKKVAKRFQQ